LASNRQRCVNGVIGVPSRPLRNCVWFIFSGNLFNSSSQWNPNPSRGQQAEHVSPTSQRGVSLMID
jgi:hypothetical protein